MQEAALDWEALHYVSATAQVQVETMAHVKLPGRGDRCLGSLCRVDLHLMFLLVPCSCRVLFRRRGTAWVEVVLSPSPPDPDER